MEQLVVQQNTILLNNKENPLESSNLRGFSLFHNSFKTVIIVVYQKEQNVH